jgi:hypothetical protein
MPIFARYIGVKYSGAEVANASLKAQRIYCAEGDAPPREVAPAPGPGRYWRRKDIAGWLVARLAEDVPTLVGIDHAFSFPLRYFETHGLAADWPQFLDDFQRHWPTDRDHTYVDFIREGMCGNHGRSQVAPAHRRTGRPLEIAFSFPGARVGGEGDARRDSVVAVDAPAARVARALLAVRRLADSRRAFCARRGLSVALSRRLCAGGPNCRSA